MSNIRLFPGTTPDAFDRSRRVGCEEAAEYLSAWIDREPVPLPVQRHVEDCSTCASQADGLRSVRELLRVGELRSDPGFVLRFQALRAAREAQDAQRFWRLWGLRLAPLAAAVALMTVALVGRERPTAFDEIEQAILSEGSESGLRLSDAQDLPGGVTWLDLSRSGTESRKDR